VKRLLFVLLAGLVLLSVQGCLIFYSCVDFEGLVVGTEYSVGDSFRECTTTMELVQFYWINGTPATGGYMQVDDNGYAGHSGNDVMLNNISLSLNFCCKPSGLTLYFGEYGGNINLEINGELANKENFWELDGASVGGVSIATTDSGGGKGTLRLSGKISSFAIGGQELWIDHVCPVR